MLCKNRSLAKSSPAGQLFPAIIIGPRQQKLTRPIASALYIYIYSSWVYHLWQSLCREMDSSLSPLDNLSTSSDEIELVKAVYEYPVDRKYPGKKIKSEQFQEKPGNLKLLMVNFN